MKKGIKQIAQNEKLQYRIYTDLALEERERYQKNVEIPGVVLEKKEIEQLEMSLTKMIIKNKSGCEAMGKPEGTYITIESRMLLNEEILEDSEIEDAIVKVICRELKKVAQGIKGMNRERKILIVGLGNEKATPDALGPLTMGQIMVKENVICIAPGVLAQTGMETYKIIKGIVREEKPDLVIAIDSLAARNTSRVATTVQITDTGITPGSGIGNYRMGLNRETLGIPVIAVGIPMVVNSVTIVHDTIEQLISFLQNYEELKDMTSSFAIFNREEKYAFIDEIMTNEMGKMYVTPKDIDDIINRLSNVLAQAINMAMA